VVDKELDKVENHQDGKESVQVDVKRKPPLNILQGKIIIKNNNSFPAHDSIAYDKMTGQR
jgi:hypothetical protein